ncbi:MAG TPA: hypothetical protein VHL58_05485 [Thermoanaerobaculia bacterium]|nr:hypothetical protein [Thermoanaerobaculia bacterium]
MNDEQFRESLRADVAGLKYEPRDEVVFARLAARIRERTVYRPQATVAGLLSRWFRPVAAALALASALLLMVTYTEQQLESIDGYSSRPEVTMAAEDLYRVVE